MTSGKLDIRLHDQRSPRAAELLRELHDAVFRPSFRPEEYVSPAVIKPGTRDALIACADDGLVVGGALGHRYPASGVLLLTYLAVRPAFRGRGVGGALMTALRDTWLEAGTPLALLEIDDPRYHPPHPGYGDPVARLRFYGAHGVRLLALPYFQPRLSPDLPRGYQMFLGVIPPAGVPLPDTVPSAPVRAFLREYFADCEGSVTGQDAEFTRLIDACGDAGVRLVRTEDFAMIPAGEQADGAISPGPTL
jgi:predicted N-acetyltransferase YhbS